MDITYLSKERYDEIQAELKVLKTEGRQALASRLKHAKELGDLSENSEYQEAREEQTRLEQKIAQLEEVLRSSSIIKKTAGTATVRIGSRVKVKKGSEQFVYTIVGSSEAEPSQGFVSNESPIGKTLLGKKVGDVIGVKAPKGDVSYQVLSID